MLLELQNGMAQNRGVVSYGQTGAVEGFLSQFLLVIT
jgi:hypothetical protein